MDNKELTEKLGKSAGALTTKSNELKEVLTRCKEVFAILAKLDVLKQEIEKNAKEIAVIKEKIEVETTNLSKYTELEQNLSESLKDRQNLHEQATSDYAAANQQYPTVCSKLSYRQKPLYGSRPSTGTDAWSKGTAHTDA